MNFTEIALSRQSCRKYDPSREVESEKLKAVLDAAILAPSACNGQPYHFTVCSGEKANEIAKHVTGAGLNRFA
ncbi:MAG: nitroreductase family protein, partial [Clostridia bacterium]|nr:nitroreductase family protein [Clostridia bacterium]